MNIYRNKKTGAIIEIKSEFGSNEIWERVPAKAEPEAIPEAPKKTRKAVKK